jgi:hypothetical protein
MITHHIAILRRYFNTFLYFYIFVYNIYIHFFSIIIHESDILTWKTKYLKESKIKTIFY